MVVKAINIPHYKNSCTGLGEWGKYDLWSRHAWTGVQVRGLWRKIHSPFLSPWKNSINLASVNCPSSSPHARLTYSGPNQGPSSHPSQIVRKCSSCCLHVYLRSSPCFHLHHSQHCPHQYHLWRSASVYSILPGAGSPTTYSSPRGQGWPFTRRLVQVPPLVKFLRLPVHLLLNS